MLLSYIKDSFDKQFLQNKDLILTLVELSLNKNSVTINDVVLKLLFAGNKSHIAYPAIEYILSNVKYEQITSFNSLSEVFYKIYDIYTELIDFSKLKNNNLIDKFIQETISNQIFTTEQSITNSTKALSADVNNSSSDVFLTQIDSIQKIGTSIVEIFTSLLKNNQTASNLNTVQLRST